MGSTPCIVWYCNFGQGQGDGFLSHVFFLKDGLPEL